MMRNSTTPSHHAPEDQPGVAPDVHIDTDETGEFAGMAAASRTGQYNTTRLKRPPTLIDRHNDPTPITPGTLLTLQFLPSGQCLTLPLTHPLILGRQSVRRPVQPIQPFVDLAPYNAHAHGVSRLHCQLIRYPDHISVVDLSSTNGTYLNTVRLLPLRSYHLADGDTLILGTLHILICLVTLAPDITPPDGVAIL